MKKKISNNDNIKSYNERKWLRIAIIISSCATIILSMANLFFNINIIFAIITCLITFILNKIRENIIFKQKEDKTKLKNKKRKE